MVSYCPDRGDLIWLNFSPQAGHEQAGHRPALVLSPILYNQKSGLALVCPITSKSKGYPFDVALPQGLPISGFIQADQLRSLDWQQREASHIAIIPPTVLKTVLGNLSLLLEFQAG